ncbi:hypothetical protein L345_16898, partial [Ophiophagus hannah]
MACEDQPRKFAGRRYLPLPVNPSGVKKQGEKTSQELGSSTGFAPHEPVAPEVCLIHPPNNLKGSDGGVQLVCFIVDFYPKDINIEWLVGGHPSLLAPYTEPPKNDVNRYTFSTSSTLKINHEDWLNENTYYCQLTHKASKTK